ncbi:Cytochrome p450 [Mycena venus]|uniref:Cytochrome p450 n=1 Tax=Mycena venus TaxID=2733690 RepID=A0A8H6Z2F0_9AGAR|nr:Cytochrome p450 [Mycena venus]
MWFTWAGSLLLAICAIWLVNRLHHVYFTLREFPTVGPSGFFGSYWAIKIWLSEPDTLLNEGYQKYPNALFKIYTQDGWTLFTSGEARLAEMRAAPDRDLSFVEHINEAFQLEVTMGPGVARDMFGRNAANVMNTVTRNLPLYFEDVRDEVNQACRDNFQVGEDWVSIPVLPATARIVSRGANRILVYPIGRNIEFTDLMVAFTREATVVGILLRTLPEFIRPTIAKLINRTESYYKSARPHLESMLAHRLEQEEKFGKDWDGKPNDYISWLLATNCQATTVRDLVFRVLGVNLPAIQTTSNSLGHSVFDLAQNPEYVEILREEIETVVAQDGWSRESLQKMVKLDSFAKESQRLWGIAPASSGRRAMKPFTFSNGQTVPAGQDIMVTTQAIHLDEGNYPGAREFRPFRWAELRSQDEKSVVYDFVTPSKTFAAFGVPSRHTCPGRFFASMLIKQALAYLVLNYDMRLEGTDRPKNLMLGSVMGPHPTAPVLFRKRQAKA